MSPREDEPGKKGGDPTMEDIRGSDKKGGLPAEATRGHPGFSNQTIT